MVSTIRFTVDANPSLRIRALVFGHERAGLAIIENIDRQPSDRETAAIVEELNTRASYDAPDVAVIFTESSWCIQRGEASRVFRIQQRRRKP